MRNALPFFVGSVEIQSSLSLEELGHQISEQLFAGVSFGGKELEIHEEVPALMIGIPVLGLKFVLEVYNHDGCENYLFSVMPWITIEGYEYSEFLLDNYLCTLLKQVFAGNEIVTIIG